MVRGLFVQILQRPAFCSVSTLTFSARHGARPGRRQRRKIPPPDCPTKPLWGWPDIRHISQVLCRPRLQLSGALHIQDIPRPHADAAGSRQAPPSLQEVEPLFAQSTHHPALVEHSAASATPSLPPCWSIQFAPQHPGHEFQGFFIHRQMQTASRNCADSATAA